MLRPANGKIARLPRPLRDELNARLRDGEPGESLLSWLNALPVVRTLLAAQFDGQPLNRQNLLAWKRGGYADWLRQLEARAWLQSLREDAGTLAAESGGYAFTAALTGPLTVALGHCLYQIGPSAPDHPEQHKALLALAAEFSRLRRCDHLEQSQRFEYERWRADQTQSSQSKPM